MLEARRFDLLDDVAPDRGQLREHHAPVIGVVHALDDPPLLHAADDAGQVREGDAELVGQPAHGRGPICFEDGQDMEVRHRQAVRLALRGPLVALVRETVLDLGEDLVGH